MTAVRGIAAVLTVAACAPAWLAACAAAEIEAPVTPAEVPAPDPPRSYVYRQIDGTALEAFVFLPKAHGEAQRANAILLFHGGGWSAGSPEWTFDAARRFAAAGLVAVSIQYRLSAGENTPIEALDDVCAAFEWTREHAGELGVADRIAGYGVSAGGHLVALAATRGCAPDGGRPAALLLWSPALDVARDTWFQKMLRNRGDVAEYSPVEHVDSSTPPTCIVHGAEDRLTPLSGAARYRDRLIEAGGTCELHVYPGLGHLLTRNLQNQERDFDPDPEARADGIARHLAFLRSRGLIPTP